MNIPIYVISLDKNLNIDEYKKYFNNVIVYPAINVKKENAKKFLDKKIISIRAYNDLINGRKDHFAFSGIGAIGLYLTHRKLFQELINNNINTPVLIFEDDCKIDNTKEFIRKINILIENKFDCAIFGPTYVKNKMKEKNIDIQFNESNNILHINNKKQDELKKDFDSLNKNIKYFYLYHSSLWSIEGIKKMNIFLKNTIEMQIDGYISILGKENYLNIFLEKNKTTSQKFHKSNLNNDNICKICYMDPKDKKYTLYFMDIVEKYTLLTVLIIITIFILFYLYNKSKC